MDIGESRCPLSVTPDDGLDDRLSEAGTLTTLFLWVTGKLSAVDVGSAFRNPMLKPLPGDGGGVALFLSFVDVVEWLLVVSSFARGILSDLTGKNRVLKIDVRLLVVRDLLLEVSSSIPGCTG